MARRKRQRSGSGDTGDGDVNLTPMLDVVFILLIFFIVTAQFIKEPGVDIVRTDVEQDDKVKRLAILVAIDANSDIYIDKKRVEPNAVEFTLKEIRSDNPKGALVVQADNDATAEVLVGLMEAITAAEGINAPIFISTKQD